MTLTPPEITVILDALEASDWDSAQVSVGDVSISVARNGAALPGTGATPTPAAPPPVPVAAAPAGNAAPAPAPVAAAPSTPSGHVICAPSVGVFWRAPRPGSPPFVEVGQRIEAGATVCIVEMMKLMNNVVSEVGGVVTAIHVENAAQVEYGAALISVEPNP